MGGTRKAGQDGALKQREEEQQFSSHLCWGKGKEGGNKRYFYEKKKGRFSPRKNSSGSTHYRGERRPRRGKKRQREEKSDGKGESGGPGFGSKNDAPAPSHIKKGRGLIPTEKKGFGDSFREGKWAGLHTEK